MVRRSFRRGLRLGLLIGALVAIVKAVQSYRAAEEPPSHAAPPSPWPTPSPKAAPVESPKAAAPVAAPKPAPEPVMEAATFVHAEPVAAPQPEPEHEPAPRRERPLRAAPAEPVRKAAKKAPAGKADERVWVEPTGMLCPPSHPIKAKLSSKLYHLPGMFAYERCKPDRCYATEPGAVADGLTKAKR